jgi:hypothetical protein
MQVTPEQNARIAKNDFLSCHKLNKLYSILTPWILHGLPVDTSPKAVDYFSIFKTYICLNCLFYYMS